MSQPPPQPRFFFPRRFCDTGFIGAFGFRHPHHFFFGGFPFFAPATCFFNGFTAFCFAQPFGFGVSPFPFGFPLGFSSVSVGGSSDQAAPAPAEAQPARPGEPAANDSGPYTYEPAPSSQPSEEGKQPPGGEARETSLPLLVLVDGSVYEITDYWLEGGRLHYLTSYGGENSLAFDRIDLQETVKRNWRRGVAFTLRPVP